MNFINLILVDTGVNTFAHAQVKIIDNAQNDIRIVGTIALIVMQVRIYILGKLE